MSADVWMNGMQITLVNAFLREILDLTCAVELSQLK